MKIKESVSLNHNELAVLIEPKGEEEDFRYYMLKENKIEFLLPVQKLYEEGMVRYLYDTTEKESFLSFSKRKRLCEVNVKQFITQLLEALIQGGEYYLEESSYLIGLEYIYLNASEDRFYFCYCPDYKEPIRQQIAGIIGCLMNLIDYEDLAAVKLVYQLYQMVGEESFSTKKILCYVKNYHFNEEKTKEKPVIITTTPELEEEKKKEVNSQVQSVMEEPVKQYYEAKSQLVKSEEMEVPLNKGTLIFIITTVAFLILFCVLYVCGVFYARIGHQLDIKKTIVYVGIAFIIEGYIAWKAFGESEKKNRPPKKLSYKLLPCNHSISDVIWIQHTPFFIGKDDTQVSGVIMDPKVSRVHGVFVIQEGDLYIKDVNSLNGTYVNEARLLPQVNQLLHLGDSIRFADAVYQLSV